jgi:hypothetical protein
MAFYQDLFVFLWFFPLIFLTVFINVPLVSNLLLNGTSWTQYIWNVTARRLKFTRASNACYLYILHFLFLRRSFLSFSDIRLSTKSHRATNSQSTCLSAPVYLVMHQVFHSVRFEVSRARNFEDCCPLAYASCNLVNFYQHSGWISFLHYEYTLMRVAEYSSKHQHTNAGLHGIKSPPKITFKSSLFSFVMELYPSQNSHFVPL